MVVAPLPTCGSIVARTSGHLGSRRGIVGTSLRVVKAVPGTASRVSRGRQPIVPSAAMKVSVAGAGGRTGSLVMKKLCEQSSVFETPTGLVRSQKSADKLRKVVGDDSLTNTIEGDISDEKVLTDLCKDADALVILTSAVPKPKIASILTALITKILPWMENKRPEFLFPDEGSPEEVDWLGQKKQIDAAVASNSVSKIILVSSMGGTQIDNFLNTMGAGGAIGEANILLWKRKAEMYLIDMCEKSGGRVSYSIIHPGGLLDKPGGERELLVGVDDSLLDGDRRSVPRTDVAEMVVQCLKMEGDASKNVSFDLASRDPGEGSRATTDFEQLLKSLNGKSADYKLPKGSPVPLP